MVTGVRHPGRRILTEDETVAVMALLENPFLLINETCISAGTRISEVLGLEIRHLNLEEGTLRIEQRSWTSEHRQAEDGEKQTQARYRGFSGALQSLDRNTGRQRS